ncbi:DUF2339 domain-containing protein [Notoacmeibacter ruber]|uniref:DUF2339 domain-containing protein n=1 Tax=Notoacmeibacter ruber TaxID=2670375 RepID=A0A3L7JCH0_9HYPH|nr:DUF2339 domain-containing protein [Notoacmeibacter ruber]RLQ87261.1 DUF2339 domain-containing protein [Notoacmeibacter ruber]
MFALLDLLSLLLPLLVIALLVSNRKLNSRVNRLEAIIASQAMSAESETRQPAEPAEHAGPESTAEAEPSPQPETAPVFDEIPAVAREAAGGDWRLEAIAASGKEGAASKGGDRQPAKADFFETVRGWLAENWFYAVSAVSLALAGIFAAQYAAEHGMLAPSVRVSLAGLFGLALIGAGEIIRRRFGDDRSVATAYLPSVFSGAGLVTLFGAVLSARALYGLIGPETTLAGLVAVAALAVILGWFYGPLLAAIGLIGATAAPFLVGGRPGAPFGLYGYFGTLSLAGLVINILRKWRFISELSLFLPYGAAIFVMLSLGEPIAFCMLSVVVSVAAVLFLAGSTQPTMAGDAWWTVVTRRVSAHATYRISVIDVFWIVAVGAMLMSSFVEPMGVIAVALALLVLFALSSAWCRTSTALFDLPLISALGLFALATIHAPAGWPRLHDFEGSTAFWVFASIAGSALAMSAIAALRSAQEEGQVARDWAVGAAAIVPAMATLLEILWTPANQLGAESWAFACLGVALAATALAKIADRTDGDDRFRPSLAALVAMTMLSLALFILLTKAALSVALAVLVLGAVVFDNRFRLPQLKIFADAAVAVLVYRSVVDPGIDWALKTSWPEFILAYGVPAGALAGAWMAGRSTLRPLEKAVIEGGFAVLAATGVTVAIMRLVKALSPSADSFTHWSLGLTGAVWLIVGFASLRTALFVDEPAESGFSTRKLTVWLRKAIAGWSLVLATVCLLSVLTFNNPLVTRTEVIIGVVGFSSLLLAYLVPALVLVAAARLIEGLPDRARLAVYLGGAVLAATYIGLSIAQAWRGNVLAGRSMSDGELWTYTVFMLLTGAGLLMAAIRQRSVHLRYAANAVLVAAILKVFLVDASDLDGLVRAGSFLVLGLALAGLAWINRRASMAAASD